MLKYLYDENAYLMSEFTIGFEFEAYIPENNLLKYEKFTELYFNKLKNIKFGIKFSY